MLNKSDFEPTQRQKLFEHLSSSIDKTVLLDEARSETTAINSTLLRVALAKVSATETLTSAGPTSDDFPTLAGAMKDSLSNLEDIADQPSHALAGLIDRPDKTPLPFIQSSGSLEHARIALDPE